MKIPPILSLVSVAAAGLGFFLLWTHDPFPSGTATPQGPAAASGSGILPRNSPSSSSLAAGDPALVADRWSREKADEAMPAGLADPQQRPLAAALQQLPASEQASFQAALHGARFGVNAVTESDRQDRPELRDWTHHASNPAQDLLFGFLENSGLRLLSGQPGKTWQGTLRLEGAEPDGAGGLDSAGTSSSDSGPASVASWKTQGTRAERTAGPLTEWYVNRTEGLEHGFTLTERPPGTPENAPVTLRLTLENLTATADPARPGDLIFTDPATSQPVLGYRDLKVWDATGQQLAAEMRPSGGGFLIAVNDTEARYPVTVDPLIVSLEARLGRNGVQKLFASDPAEFDAFGYSLAIEGDYAMVGVPWNDHAGTESGSVYVFYRTGSLWSEVAKLTSSDAAAGDLFGESVAISGDFAIIGAPGNDDEGTNSGTAYLFFRNGSTWIEHQKIIDSLTSRSDRFGGSVAISGDIAIVGSPGDDRGGFFSGSVTAFVRQPSNYYTRQLALAAPDVGEGDNFGDSISLSGEYAIIGAYGDDDAGSDAGAAYVFKYQGNFSPWVQQAKLTAPDAAAGDYFGSSVAMSGIYAIIGAPGNGDAGPASGAAYIFHRNDTIWYSPNKLTASDAAAYKSFGGSVAISGDSAVVGGTGTGKAYVFDRTSSWIQRGTLTAADSNGGPLFSAEVAISGDTALIGAREDGTFGFASGAAHIYKLIDTRAGDAFGLSVDVDGDTAVAGALDHDHIGMASTGKAWVFRRSGTVWEQEAGLINNPPGVGDRFGVAVAVQGNRVVIGSDRDDEPNFLGTIKTDCGSASVFERNPDGNWVRLVKLGSDGAAGDHFGRSVAMSQNTIVVGAPGAYAGGGKALTYTNGSSFIGQALSPASAQAGAQFGFSVAVSGQRIIVGAPRTDTPALGISIVDTGRIHYFKPDSFLGLWQNDGSNAPLQAHACAGFSLALDGNTAVVGASGPTGWAGGDSAGASGRTGKAFVVTHNGTAWNSGFTYLDATDLPPAAWFGMSVAVAGDLIAVGAFGQEIYTGQVRLFRRDGAAWVKQLDTDAASAESDNAYGISVALSGDTLMVGGYKADGNQVNAGMAWVYRVEDAGSAGPVLTITRSGPNAVLTWPAGTGLALWKSPTLSAGSWVKITGSEALTTHSVPVSAAPRMFFRLAPP